MKFSVRELIAPGRLSAKLMPGRWPGERSSVAGNRVFVIRRTFLLPLGILLLFCLALLAACLVQGEPTGKIIILGFIILPVLVLFLESVRRRAVIGENEVTVIKLLRRKSLPLAQVTSVDTVQVRRRAFLTLSTDEHFLIFSNAYADFPGLVGELLRRVPSDTVTEKTRRMAQAPPAKSTDIFSCWLAVALVALLLYIQLGGRF